MVLATFRPDAPYDLGALLRFLQRHPVMVLDYATPTAYRRVFSQGEALALVEAQQTPGGITLAVLAHAGTLDLPHLIAQAQQVLALAAPQRTAFWAQCAGDARLHPVLGLPLLRAADPLEALLNVIIEQHITWRSALRAQHWLLTWGGRCLIYDDQPYYAYPTPQQLAAASVDDLKPLKITLQRIGLLRQLAQSVSAGTLPLAEIVALPHEAAMARLQQIKGIGHWTAAVTLGRVHGHYAEVAWGDVALQAAVARFVYGTSGRATPDALRAALLPYGEQAGAAAFYLLARYVIEAYGA